MPKLDRLAFIITNYCNLNCRLCSSGIPYLKERFNISLEEFERTTRAAFDIVDYTNSLEITGGEPLLHKDLPKMIEFYNTELIGRFNQWLIVTNGLLTPSDDLLAAFEKYKANGFIHISDYGQNLKKTAEFENRMKEIGITYRLAKYYGDDQYQGGWIDPGEVVKFNRSEDELKEVYKNCGIVKNGGCYRIYKGKLHYCTRSSRCYDEGVDLPADYVDLTDNSTAAERLQKLEKIIAAPYLLCCDYCKGELGTNDKSKRYKAGEQIQRNETP
jgi:hypothetical protein